LVHTDALGCTKGTPYPTYKMLQQNKINSNPVKLIVWFLSAVEFGANRTVVVWWDTELKWKLSCGQQWKNCNILFSTIVALFAS